MSKKISCGGFCIGDGLSLNGNVLNASGSTIPEISLTSIEAHGGWFVSDKPNPNTMALIVNQADGTDNTKTLFTTMVYETEEGNITDSYLSVGSASSTNEELQSVVFTLLLWVNPTGWTDMDEEIKKENRYCKLLFLYLPSM